MPLLHHLPPPLQVTFLQLDRFSPYFHDPGAYQLSGVEPEPVYTVIYPDQSIDMRKLAYRFQFDSPEQRDPLLRATWSRLVGAVAEWRREHPHRGLWWIDERERLVITEERSGKLTRHVLTGSAAVLFRICSNATKSMRSAT